MFPRIAEARHLEAYRVELTLTNGEKVEPDLVDRIVGRGGMLAPLEDVNFFGKVEVDPEVGTLVWPNGVDLCPDVLYSEATGKPLPELDTTSV